MKRIIQVGAIITIFSLLIGCNMHQKVTLGAIQKDVVGKSIDMGSASWLFENGESREISIIESKYSRDKATIVIDTKTQSVPDLFGVTRMAGKIRLYYEWIANEWNLIRMESLTFKEI